MVLPGNTVFEVQSGGSDNNGGGFVTGATGTDYSQTTTAHVAIDNSTITATATNATPSVMTLSGYTVANGDVGNLVTLTGGTNIVAGTYQIASVNTGTNKWTLDRNCCSGGAGSAITGNMGGAFATPGKALGLMSRAGMITYIKAATYAIGSAISVSFGVTNRSLNRIIGYSSTRGDGGRATLQASAGSFTMLTFTVSSGISTYSFENLVFDGNSQTAIDGLDISASYSAISFHHINCIYKNFTNAFALRAGGGACLVYGCEIGPNAFTYDGGNGGGIENATADNCVLYVDSCYVHDNTISTSDISAGIYDNNDGLTVVNSVIYNNTGTNMHGIYEHTFVSTTIRNNIIHANEGDGILMDNASAANIVNNIITGNGRYGINLSINSPVPSVMSIHNNAYYNNGTAATNGFTSGGNDQTLSGLPYNSAGSDFGLNQTAGQGAACRGTGVPGTIGLASVVGTGYLDIGPLQHFGSQTSAYTFVS